MPLFFSTHCSYSTSPICQSQTPMQVLNCTFAQVHYSSVATSILILRNFHLTRHFAYYRFAFWKHLKFLYHHRWNVTITGEILYRDRLIAAKLMCPAEQAAERAAERAAEYKRDTKMSSIFPLIFPNCTHFHYCFSANLYLPLVTAKVSNF